MKTKKRDRKPTSRRVGSGDLLGASCGPMSGKTHVLQDWLNSKSGDKTIKAWKRDYEAAVRRFNARCAPGKAIVLKMPAGNWDKGHWVSA